MKTNEYTLQEIPIQELLKKAHEFQRLKKKWHFHILLPGCKFNNKKLHAFVLENETDIQYFVSYSKKRRMNEGKIMVKLLYGEMILENVEDEQHPPKEIECILERARALNKICEEWEHHLLSPKCIFNKNKGKWVNVFEDNEEVVESIMVYEPISDLKKIERLYYAQKK